MYTFKKVILLMLTIRCFLKLSHCVDENHAEHINIAQARILA